MRVAWCAHLHSLDHTLLYTVYIQVNRRDSAEFRLLCVICETAIKSSKSAKAHVRLKSHQGKLTVINPLPEKLAGNLIWWIIQMHERMHCHIMFRHFFKIVESCPQSIVWAQAPISDSGYVQCTYVQLQLRLGQVF